MKIALLHSRLSGYLVACLRALKQRTEVELLIYAWPNQADAPFDVSVFADLGRIVDRSQVDVGSIHEEVAAFSPDAVLVSGWADKGYVKVCSKLKATGVPVIAGCDTQWKGNLRQRVASWIAPWHVQKFIDVLWVTGERQATLARALGYEGDCLWEGYYACDWERFAQSSRDSTPLPSKDFSEGEGGLRPRGGGARGLAPLTGKERPLAAGNRRQVPGAPTFLFVGRYVDVKGIDTLVEAYRMYREQVGEPWALKCAGAGPLRDDLLAVGAEDLGFVQPDDLPTVMGEATAFVLPSRFEPWGVVVQEAAASGLPLICSDACGAGVHLLRDRWNGRSFAAGNASHLAECLLWIHQQSDADLEALGQNSFELSKQYTPKRWAETLLEGIK